MGIILFIALILSVSAMEPKLKQPKLNVPKLQHKLKPIDPVAPKSTYRKMPEPIIKPMPKLEPLRTKPLDDQSEMDDIKIKKLKPIKLDEKPKGLKQKAPSLEPFAGPELSN